MDAPLTISPDQSPNLYFPIEVCENVIDMLYYSDDMAQEVGNIATLRNSTLVCRAWHVRARRMLFYSIYLTNTVSLHKLAALLHAKRFLSNYVCEVTVIGHNLHTTASVLPAFLSVLAGQLPNIHKLSVKYFPKEEMIQWYLRPAASNPNMAKELPYTLLHPSYPAFLSSFMKLSSLHLEYVIFKSFGEFARMLYSIPNLEVVRCNSIEWDTFGPLPAFMVRSIDNRKSSLRRFSQKLREIEVYDVTVLGAARMISACGPQLTTLNVGIPLWDHEVEKFTNGEELDLSSCLGLEELVVALTWFSVYYRPDNADFCALLQSWLSSWKPPKQPAPRLIFGAYHCSCHFARMDFLNALSVVATILDKWLQSDHWQATNAVDIDSSSAEPKRIVRCRLIIDIYDGDAWKEGWWQYLQIIFATWAKLEMLEMRYKRPQSSCYQWAPDQKPSETTTNTAQT